MDDIVALTETCRRRPSQLCTDFGGVIHYVSIGISCRHIGVILHNLRLLVNDEDLSAGQLLTSRRRGTIEMATGII